MAARAERGGRQLRPAADRRSWFIGLEWSNPAGDYRAAQDDAARLDTILVMAEKYGVSLQIVVLWHQALTTYQGVPVVIPNNPARPDTSAELGQLQVQRPQRRTARQPRRVLRRRARASLVPPAAALHCRALGLQPAGVHLQEMIDEIDRTTSTIRPSRQHGCK
ncbi:MAG: hypothetical protein U0703_21785 [Anaerolineae bacterium]